jgi:arylsulfatase
LGERPNIVLIFTDDQGYADLGCYGGDHVRTPHLDALARSGTRFTQFYVAQAVCSASRAALLTGCYPNRVGIRGALGPGATGGLASTEWTLAEMLRDRGYATAMVGKWHLGHLPGFLPTTQGFDSYFGLPYSNDMWWRHPENWEHGFGSLPLIRDTSVIDTLQDQYLLTQRYTQEAVQFIESRDTTPFFLYLAHSMPHVPLYHSPEFAGETGLGTYADVIAEIDWSVGRVVAALERRGLSDNTLIIFTSDNGPWLSYGGHAGRTGPWREGKGTSFEGGIRVPGIAAWPGHIPAGATVAEPLMTIDVLPSLAKLVAGRLPDHPIDGRDRLSTLLNYAPGPAPEPYFIYWLDELHAVISADGRWKLHLPHTYRGLQGHPPRDDGIPVRYIYGLPEGPSLYDLHADPGETRNLLGQHPEIVRMLRSAADSMRRVLGDDLLQVEGVEVR